MHTRHPTTNLLDDILFLGLLIITPAAVALYLGVVTIIGTAQYQAVVEHGTAATTAMQAWAAAPCANCTPLVVVR